VFFARRFDDGHDSKICIGFSHGVKSNFGSMSKVPGEVIK